MKVNIADDFSLYPMGRTIEDGPDNGERFFNEFLKENLDKGIKTRIIFDGVRAFGSSFLDQVFNVKPSSLGIKRDLFQSLVEIEAKGQAYVFYRRMAEDYTKKIPK